MIKGMQWSIITVIDLMAKSKRAIIYAPSNSLFVSICVRDPLFICILIFRDSNIKAYFKQTF